MKTSVKKKEKVPKLTEEQYAEYVMSLKDEKPIGAYKEMVTEHQGVSPQTRSEGGEKKER